MCPLLALSFGLIIGLPRLRVPCWECWEEALGAVVEGCATCECGWDGARVDCVEAWGAGVGYCDGGWDGWVGGWAAGVSYCDGCWDGWVIGWVAGVGCCDGGWDGWVIGWAAGVGSCDGGWDGWVVGWAVRVASCDCGWDGWVGAWGQCLLLWPSSLHIRHLLHNPAFVICVSSFLSSHSCNLLFFFGLPGNDIFGGG